MKISLLEAIEKAQEKIKNTPKEHLRRLACLDKLKLLRKRGLVDETVYLVDDQGNLEVDYLVIDYMMGELNDWDIQKKKSKLFVMELKSILSCNSCVEKDPSCLDFHHLNPKDKEFSIAVATNSGFSIKRIIEEIKKCVVVCSNCHRKEHQKSKIMALDSSCL